VQYARAVLRRALGQAVKWDLVPRNVVPLVDAPQVDKHRITPFDEIQARKLLAAATGHRLEALYGDPRSLATWTQRNAEPRARFRVLNWWAPRGSNPEPID